MSSRTYASVLTLCLLLSTTACFAGPTLDAVKARGFVKCGVNQSSRVGFSGLGTDGHWAGIDLDMCRGVAAAVLGDASKVRFTPLTVNNRLKALQAGKIDVPSRNTTWTFTRDTALGITFVGTLYYDGQGFMVRKKLRANTLSSLEGKAVCVISDTTTELNLVDYLLTHGMSVKPVPFPNAKEAIDAYDSERCQVLTGDQSALLAWRLELKGPEAHDILPEIISKEPLGPAVRDGDHEWLKIVRWTLFAFPNAEEMSALLAKLSGVNIKKLKERAEGQASRQMLRRAAIDFLREKNILPPSVNGTGQ